MDSGLRNGLEGCIKRPRGAIDAGARGVRCSAVSRAVETCWKHEAGVVVDTDNECGTVDNVGLLC